VFERSGVLDVGKLANPQAGFGLQIDAAALSASKTNIG
jgi:hypothetical protein